MAQKRKRTRPKRNATKKAQRAEVAAKLDALYAELPRLECKGLCAHSCTAIDMTPAERTRMRQAGAPEIPPIKDTLPGAVCPALKDGRCSVYEVRPMLCRLWGVDETMRCPHGCVPEGGWISDADGGRFLTRSALIGGWPTSAPKPSMREVAESLRTGRPPSEVRNRGSRR